MRFLADAGISPKTVEFLIRLGHQADHVRALGLERSPDRTLVERANADSLVIVTFDLDFGDILAWACRTSQARSSSGSRTNAQTR